MIARLAGKIARRLRHKYQVTLAFLQVRYLAAWRTRRVFLLGTPWYGNVGDQAIAIGECYALESVYPGYTIIEVPQDVIRSEYGRYLGLGIDEDDILYLQGGGNLGSLYVGEEELRRYIITRYPQNRLVIMPVSIFFHTNEIGQRELAKSRDVYARARDLTIIARDRVSYDFARREFSTTQVILAPDIVTTLAAATNSRVMQPVAMRSAEQDPAGGRGGVLFFLRSDKECVRDDSLVAEMEQIATALGECIFTADNIVPDPVYDAEREQVVAGKLSAISAARLVVTDRFHGLIFAVITRTPVIVLKSYDSKIASGVNWFSALPWVYYGDNVEKSTLLAKMREYLANDYVVTGTTDCGAKIIAALKSTCKE